MDGSFSAIMIDKNDVGQTVEIRQISEAELPEGNVLIDVEFSTLNFKDGLAVTGKVPVVRKYPMVPGIDLAGTVKESSHPEWHVGDKVVLNGWGVGEAHWGGLAQKARLDGDWLVPLPAAFTSRQAMILGTAGYTAALCVNALVEGGLTPDKGEVLVTGATGGVGSVAIALLRKAGFTVVAATGKAAESDYLKDLGASATIDRAELLDAGKAMQMERWSGVVDTLGGRALVNACAQTRYGGIVAACGLAAGSDFPATVMPFILRSVRLQGVDSVMAPKAARLAAWKRLADDMPITTLEKIAIDIGLDDVVAAAEALMNAAVRGRYVVNVNA
ncbi:alcohol dehydrogenase [Sphingobium sp. SCG-1]|uniref:acrylyl-CoA reductase (NADPH) n=1 Tax=Sphingobium sp. SCG-1 TaxID=2072936 RepID=UPI000CD69896|nr:MDR family oxidoreductase [Sphingobium sp. SCG-1]AUW56993.1 alcohol dehydrogenase [Sphingobium sp. SCG-1]